MPKPAECSAGFVQRDRLKPVVAEGSEGECVGYFLSTASTIARRPCSTATKTTV